MKLLILTQVMDKKDSSLGFFQRWVEVLAPNFSHIDVVCLKKGDYRAPENVAVYSLGKEYFKESNLWRRVLYVVRFYRLVWNLRKNYDMVFVHMNQEYVLLGGILWKILGKKIFMWRNHYAGSFLTNIAVFFCDKVFCTSKFSYTARFKKTVLMPVGVDEQSIHLEEAINRIPRSILFLGRLDISKRPDLLLDALGALAARGVDFTATFVGGASELGSSYEAMLHAKAEALKISDRVVFVGAVPNTETYRYYRSHEIFVNCSKSGMFDKTIFKAVASGCLVLATSRDFGNLVGDDFIFTENDVTSLTEKLEEYLSKDEKSTAEARVLLGKIIKQHSLPVLATRITEELKSVV